MSKECDVTLLGTGVAPLVAAFTLLGEGKSVLLLNPDRDFFCENSELPFDPLWPILKNTFSPDRLTRNSSHHALSILRPNYPGAIEYWPNYEKKGFHDFLAPHVRSRDRVWIRSPILPQKNGEVKNWEVIEDMYLSSLDAGLNARLLEKMTASRSFPGFSSNHQWDPLRGISIGKLCDMDVSRYQNGLLEFVRERLASDRCIVEASQIELTNHGIRYSSQGQAHAVSIREELLVFWTPALTAWVLAQTENKNLEFPDPKGVRLWEEWSLISRETLDPSFIGVFEELFAWATTEGVPEHNPNLDPTHLHRLSVLRAGPLIPLENWHRGQLKSQEGHWASSESFDALSRLCHDFLGWEYFSVRSLRPRAVFEWQETLLNRSTLYPLLTGKSKAYLITGCDGPLLEVVHRTNRACAERSLI